MKFDHSDEVPEQSLKLFLRPLPLLWPRNATSSSGKLIHVSRFSQRIWLRIKTCFLIFWEILIVQSDKSDAFLIVKFRSSYSEKKFSLSWMLKFSSKIASSFERLPVGNGVVGVGGVVYLTRFGGIANV